MRMDEEWGRGEGGRPILTINKQFKYLHSFILKKFHLLITENEINEFKLKFKNYHDLF